MLKKKLILIICSLSLPLLASLDNKHVARVVTGQSDYVQALSAHNIVSYDNPRNTFKKIQVNKTLIPWLFYAYEAYANNSIKCTSSLPIINMHLSRILPFNKTVIPWLYNIKHLYMNTADTFEPSLNARTDIQVHTTTDSTLAQSLLRTNPHLPLLLARQNNVDILKTAPHNTQDSSTCITQATFYTVNLMWINRKFNDKQLYIYPDASFIHENFLNHIFRWAQVTHNGIVQLWFDSALTPKHAIKNTQHLIHKYSKEHPKSALIRLRDVRSLPLVQEHPEVFSDKTPVYFRVDLLRAIAALDNVNTSNYPYFVYSDMDMQPLSESQLFGDKTRTYLKKFGIVMAHGGHLGFENGFQIVSNHNINLLYAMRHALVDLNIARAYNALKGELCNVSGRFDERGPTAPLQQIVYDSYPSMFKYFYQLEGLGILKIDSVAKNKKVYNFKKHGLKYFGLTYLDNTWLGFTSENKQLWNKRGLWVPTIKVPLPPAGLQYD